MLKNVETSTIQHLQLFNLIYDNFQLKKSIFVNDLNQLSIIE